MIAALLDRPRREMPGRQHVQQAHFYCTYSHSSRFVYFSTSHSSSLSPLYHSFPQYPLYPPFLSATPPLQRRTNRLTLPSPADIVQDMYLKELKSYKSAAVKPSDADGHVQKWAAPAAPKSPEEADIASELKAYEASSVDVEGQAEGGAAVEEEQDWFEEEKEEEEHH